MRTPHEAVDVCPSDALFPMVGLPVPSLSLLPSSGAVEPLSLVDIDLIDDVSGALNCRLHRQGDETTLLEHPRRQSTRRHLTMWLVILRITVCLYSSQIRRKSLLGIRCTRMRKISR